MQPNREDIETSPAVTDARPISRPPSFSEAIGEFRRALQTVVQGKATREFGNGLTDGRKIEVLPICPLANLGNLGIVDLDLVMDLIDGQAWAGCQRHEGRGG
jgi:hypothetical protein